MARTKATPDRTHRRRAVERESIALKPVLIAIAALFVVIGVCAGLVSALEGHYRVAYARPGTLLDASGMPATTGPAPQPAPQADLAAFRAEKGALLESYGWVDRPHNVVHIPIERAMRLLATRQSAQGASP
jgi:hypothetical protein